MKCLSISMYVKAFLSILFPEDTIWRGADTIYKIALCEDEAVMCRMGAQ